MFLVGAVSSATYYKNIRRGSGSLSEYESFFMRSRSVTDISQIEDPNFVKHSIPSDRPEADTGALRVTTRASNDFVVRDAVYLWRDAHLWFGLVRITFIVDHSVRLMWNECIKTAETFWTHRYEWSLAVNDSDECVRGPSLDIVAPQIDVTNKDIATIRPKAQPGRCNMSRMAQELTDETRRFKNGLPRSRTRKFAEPHMVAFAKSSSSTITQEHSPTERFQSYDRVKQSWIDWLGYERVDMSSP